MSKFGDRVRQLREATGLQQDEAARRMGLHKNALWRYENGRAQPRVDMVERIAQALGITPGELFEEPKRPKVRTLPSTPLTDLLPEDLDERLGELGSAAEVEKLLNQIRAEESDLEAFQVTTLPAKLTRARIYRAAILDRWTKLADPRDTPPKFVREIAREVAGSQEWLRDFVREAQASAPAS